MVEQDVAVLGNDGENIEAQRYSVGGILLEPFQCGSPQPCLLDRCDGFLRRAIMMTAPRLDLDDGDRVLLGCCGDDVELAETSAEILCDDFVAIIGENCRCEILSRDSHFPWCQMWQGQQVRAQDGFLRIGRVLSVCSDHGSSSSRKKTVGSEK